MKLQLTFRDRLVLQGILPKQGGLITMSLVQELQEKIRITSKEVERVKMKEDKRGITWDQTAEGIPLSIDLTPSLVKVLKDSAKQVDKEEKVTTENIDLIKQLMELKEDVQVQ